MTVTQSVGKITQDILKDVQDRLFSLSPLVRSVSPWGCAASLIHDGYSVLPGACCWRKERTTYFSRQWVGIVWRLEGTDKFSLTIINGIYMVFPLLISFLKRLFWNFDTEKQYKKCYSKFLSCFCYPLGKFLELVSFGFDGDISIVTEESFEILCYSPTSTDHFLESF